MKKILVAHPEEALCLLYQEELAEEGYHVVATSNPKDFMQVVETESPDLILLDIKLNEKNNNIFLRDIRSHLLNTPIVLCTTYSPSKQSLEDLGVDDFVIKSSNLDEMRVKIRRILTNGAELVPPRTRLIDSKAERRFQEQMRLFFRE